MKKIKTEVDINLLIPQNPSSNFGGVPEWPKGSDCKSDGSAFGGSNPPPSTIFSTLYDFNSFAGVV